MKRINWASLIFSIFLSISINLKFVIDKDLDFFIKKFSINYLFVLKIIIASILIYSLLKLCYFVIDKIPLNNKKILLDKKKIVLIFVGVFTTTMIYSLVYYPGVYLSDTTRMLYDPISMSCIQPIFYGMGLSLLFFSLKIMFSKTISIFIMSTIQAFISSVIITYIIVWFNKKINNKVLTILLICYYVLLPIVSNYNMALNKDTLFSLMLLIFFTHIYEIVSSKGKIISDNKFVFKLILVSIITSYIRNNGIYIIALSLFITFLVYGIKHYKLKYIITLLVIILFSFLPTIVIKMWDVEYFKREYYAIPIQNISYTIKYHSESLTKKEYMFLSKIIKDPKRTIKNNYNPFNVDRIKCNKNFNVTNFNKYEKEFLLLWIKKSKTNTRSYIKSYLLNTYHLWSVNRLKSYQSIIDKADTKYVKQSKKIYNKRILPTSIQNILIKFYNIFNTYFNPAGCFIILIIANLYSLYKKRKETLILSTPLIGIWIILMLSVPFSQALRYMAPYIYILPIIILYVFKVTRNNTNI